MPSVWRGARPLKRGEPETQLTVELNGGQMYISRQPRIENGNPGLMVVRESEMEIPVKKAVDTTLVALS